jgi:hypothetical protein
MLSDGFIMDQDIFRKLILLLRGYDKGISSRYHDKLIYLIYSKLPQEYRNRFNKEAPYKYRLFNNINKFILLKSNNIKH